MESSRLQDWLQVIGMFGVMASLLFVGLQLKQAQDIAQAEVYNARVSASVDFNSSILGSPEALSALAKLYDGGDVRLSPVEEVAAERYFGSYFHLIEGNHQQYLNGFLPEEHWQRNLAGMQCTLTVPFARAVVDSWQYRASFQAIIDQIIADMPADVENCYSAEWSLPLY